MYDEKRTITLSHHAKTGIHLAHLGFQHSRNCISQPRYFSRMNFNIRAQCDFIFYNFHCTLPRDTMDVEVTIWTVDGIHTYRKDRMTQVALCSPWSRQVKPFPSLRKKIAEYQEEKRRSFNPFTPVKEINFGKKRSRRSQKNRKCRKLDMGCFVPSTVASTCQTTTNTTTMVNLSAPSNPPSILDVPKLPAPSKPSKNGQNPTSHQYYFHPQYILFGHQKKIGNEPSRKRERS